MKVYIVRHGESQNNKDGLWTGWFDAPLTEKGREDAAQAFELLSKTKFDKIYSSDLSRAKSTAEIAIPGCFYETSELLREINVGELAGTPIKLVDDNQKKAFGKKGYIDVGGESRDAFRVRVSEFMKKLESLDCENVAVFFHGGWLRIFLDTVIGLDLPRKNICCNNCTVAIFEYVDSVWRLLSWINVDR